MVFERIFMSYSMVKLIHIFTRNNQAYFMFPLRTVEVQQSFYHCDEVFDLAFTFSGAMASIRCFSFPQVIVVVNWCVPGFERPTLYLSSKGYTTRLSLLYGSDYVLRPEL